MSETTATRVRDGIRRIAAVVLSDATIARLLAESRIEIDPYDESLLQPSSVDVRVDRLFRVFHNNRYPYIDVKAAQEDLTELVELADSQPFVLHPGEFVLGSTLERVRLPEDLVARLDGKSSLGRLGLLIHSTAGFIDPGWDGHVTLELSNVANLPITIYYGMKIGQLSFVQLTEPAETPYGADALGSKYQGQQGPTPSRYCENFSRERARPRGRETLVQRPAISRERQGRYVRPFALRSCRSPPRRHSYSGPGRRGRPSTFRACHETRSEPWRTARRTPKERARRQHRDEFLRFLEHRWTGLPLARSAGFLSSALASTSNAPLLDAPSGARCRGRSPSDLSGSLSPRSQPRRRARLRGSPPGTHLQR